MVLLLHAVIELINEANIIAPQLVLLAISRTGGGSVAIRLNGHVDHLSVAIRERVPFLSRHDD